MVSVNSSSRLHLEDRTPCISCQHSPHSCALQMMFDWVSCMQANEVGIADRVHAEWASSVLDMVYSTYTQRLQQVRLACAMHLIANHTSIEIEITSSSDLRPHLSVGVAYSAHVKEPFATQCGLRDTRRAGILRKDTMLKIYQRMKSQHEHNGFAWLLQMYVTAVPYQARPPFAGDAEQSQSTSCIYLQQ